MSISINVSVLCYMYCDFFFFSSRRRHTRCALVTGVQTCALPISQQINRCLEGAGVGRGQAALNVALNVGDLARQRLLYAPMTGRPGGASLVAAVDLSDAQVDQLHAALGQITQLCLGGAGHDRQGRTEEPRHGEVCVSTCRARGSPDTYKKKKNKHT